jgi:hypothetical protein
LKFKKQIVKKNAKKHNLNTIISYGKTVALTGKAIPVRRRGGP